MIAQILQIMSWLALPVGLYCVIDDWFLRPRRQIAAASQTAAEPRLATLAYYVLPFLVIAAVLRLLIAERLDFSLVLFAITVVSGVVWALDAWWLRGRRAARAAQAGAPIAAVTEPGTIDYARSFFPVALAVLVLRAFVFEPFRIPSDSMMPTLLDGDFIVVNKFAYGLRWPVVNKKFLGLGEPRRGDVVVFRYPPDPSVNYIKRLAGLPGDRIRIESDRIVINDAPVPLTEIGRYNDGCYDNMRLAEEQLGEHRHRAMFCRSPGYLDAPPSGSCDRRFEPPRSYYCDESGEPGQGDSGDYAEVVVPPGRYFMVGDNRDNSADSRRWQFVREELLVGKATRIWFNWDLQRTGGPKWERIGARID